MTKDVQRRQPKRRRLWLALVLLVAILVAAIVPPLVSLSRYKSRITQLMAASLGRPVHLSTVELRLLPRPGFVLTDLTVEEDPAYGVEPVLHANTVTASIRLLSLWRGRLEIGTISLDEASLNLVRTDEGRWNMDSLFRTAAAHVGGTAADGAGAGAGQRKTPLPYLEATNSRINIKIGVEKLPFSLISTDLSFWQEKPGDWRIRLRGQPARTDLSLDLADTGVVRLEANMHRAAELRQMPVHLDLEWREAQLGQLTRLVIGSDSGWRGDLTGELQMDGTADAAQIKTRLRATGVHRAEFTPASPLDFDANCGFVYHFSARSLENLVCDSPLGDGRIRIAGDLPSAGGPHFSVELDRIPVAAGLDALRTVRSGLDPGLEAKGIISGKIAYAESGTVSRAPEKAAGKAHPVEPGPLTGSLTVEGFQLSGDGLSTPILAPRLVLEPVAGTLGQQSDQHHPAARNSSKAAAPSPAQPPALSTTAAIPAGGISTLTVTARLMLSGYQVTVRGQSSLVRAKELARVAGMQNAAALDSLAGSPVTVDLKAEGPWQPAQEIPFSSIPSTSAISSAVSNSETQAESRPAALPPAADESPRPDTDSLSGTVTFHNANWKADYLASHVEISQATLYLDNGEIRWDPVVFSYGPVKGTATLTLPAVCDPPQPCPPHFQVQFGDLDASALQVAILGAHEPGTLLSSLIARLTTSTTPAWPQLEGTVKADSLILGPVTLREASATLRILPTGAEITSLDAGLLGGRVHGSGALHAAGTDQGKPSYTLEGQFEKLSPAAVGQLLGLRWSGGVLDADGKIDLSGFTGKDLTGSAKGTLHFEWRHGAVEAQGVAQRSGKDNVPATASVPPALARFDRWTGDTEIANGAMTLKQNEVWQGSRERAVEVTLTFGTPPKVAFAMPRETQAKK
jgi:AsmA-like protein